ncbi:uncharacterized protein [Rutidosis leptorrhynchoides]|uniref:uncharacterized protein n=1 Tax=Rutidosis leptorrhynchoides TaxID=125765 RepID=UPI003A98D4CA
MYNDATERVRVCQEYQQHAPVSKAPWHSMTPITSPCPFCKWAINIVGPFPSGVGNADFLVVTIDFFTKWVKAKPVNKITSKKNAIFRLGKHRLPIRHSKRDNELPKVLWEHWTTSKHSTSETPFILVYGSEAVLPAEIAILAERILWFSQDQNSEDLRTNLDLLEKRRKMAATHEAIIKQRIARYYDKRVRLITYAVGDLVWRDNQASRFKDTDNLGPNWERLFKVIRISKTGT